MTEIPETILQLLIVDPPSEREQLIKYLEELRQHYMNFQQTLPRGNEEFNVFLISQDLKIKIAILLGSKYAQPTDRNIQDIYTFLSRIKQDPLTCPDYKRGRGYE